MIPILVYGDRPWLGLIWTPCQVARRQEFPPVFILFVFNTECMPQFQGKRHCGNAKESRKQPPESNPPKSPPTTQPNLQLYTLQPKLHIPHRCRAHTNPLKTPLRTRLPRRRHARRPRVLRHADARPGRFRAQPECRAPRPPGRLGQVPGAPRRRRAPCDPPADGEGGGVLIEEEETAVVVGTFISLDGGRLGGGGFTR